MEEKLREDHEEETENAENTEKIDKEFVEEAWDTIVKDAIIKEAFGDSGENNIYVQLSINNLNMVKKGIVAGDHARFEDLEFLDGQKSNENYERAHGQKCEDQKFQTDQDVKEWVRKHFGAYEFALLLAVAVFHDMPYIWINTNAKALFLKGELLGEDEKKESMPAKDDLLSEIGAVTYSGYIVTNGGETETEFAAFADERIPELVLKYVWEQYLDYRSTLVDWVKLYAYRGNLSQSHASVAALGIWAQIDFGYFESRHLNALVEEKSLIVTAGLMELIAQNPRCRENVKLKTIHWGGLQSNQYVMLALMITQKLEWENSIIMDRYLSGCLLELDRGRAGLYVRKIPIMYAVGQRKASYYKVIVKTLYGYTKKIIGRYSDKDREKLNFIFYILLESDLELKHMRRGVVKEMILVKMLFIRNEYRDYLTVLWENAWKDRRIGGQIKQLMKQYWQEMLLQDENYERKKMLFYRRMGERS